LTECSGTELSQSAKKPQHLVLAKSIINMQNCLQVGNYRV